MDHVTEKKKLRVYNIQRNVRYLKPPPQSAMVYHDRVPSSTHC